LTFTEKAALEMENEWKIFCHLDIMILDFYLSSFATSLKKLRAFSRIADEL